MVSQRLSANPGAVPRVPGVYYEHRWAYASREPVFCTGVPAFIGYAAERRTARPHACPWLVLQRWEEFDLALDGMGADAYLRHAVKGFFDNGGARCVVVPVMADASNPTAMAAALMAPLRPGGVMEDLDLIDLVCVPDLMLLAAGDAGASVYDVQIAVLAHCARMGNRFAILDALPGGDDAGDDAAALAGNGAEPSVERALRHWEGLAPGHGALYFPWIRVQPLPGKAEVALAGNDSHGRVAETVRVPPCGHVAGVYARTDLRAGPHQAPANEVVHQAVRLDLDLDDAQHALLNDRGVNCLRSLPGRGIRVWGARTLSGEAAWRYVNVRRLFLTLARWVEQHCGDLVFEANDAQLWERLAQRLRAYCGALFDQGALAGRSAVDAFHVKCDAETNPPASVGSGMVVAEVGLAPVAPAEFVVVRITQHAGSPSAGMPSAIG